MGQLTVKDLLKECQKQIQAGNGDKYIVISDDNEGNGFHGMFYGFTKIEETPEMKQHGITMREAYPIYDSHYEDEYEKLIILG